MAVKVLLTGGGSGGHITPVLAVAKEIKRRSPGSSLCFIGGRRDKYMRLAETGEGELFDKKNYIFAGKLRRYHGESWLKKLLDIKTNILNTRDLFLVAAGLAQSFWILVVRRPDVVFIKGGYVTLPVGIMAALLRIPYITHDSDAVPGLTNRIVGRWARYNSINLPSRYHKYKQDKTVPVGIPARGEFKIPSPAEIKRTKQSLKISPRQQVLLITGGSQGARSLNQAMVKLVPELLRKDRDLAVIHQAGKGNTGQWGEFTHPRLIVKEFIDDLHKYSGAADVIITRAGASALAEYARQKKPCLVVPHPHLAGGHQLKNAEVLEEKKAAKVISQEQLANKPDEVEQIVLYLLYNPAKRWQLGNNLSELMPAGASAKLAKLILKTGSDK